MGDGLSLRGTDVAAMMTRVEATVTAAERSPEGAMGVLPVAPEGDTEVNVAVLRRTADIRVDFPPGSGRPLVGPAVRLAKRALRRAVSWYVTPMMDQQSRLNHALLDSIERLRLRIEPLRSDPGRRDDDELFPLGTRSRAVAVGPAARALVYLLAARPPEGRVRVLADDPAGQVRGLDEASLDVLVADVTGMGPEALIELVRAASHALVPGATIVLSSSAPLHGDTSLHPRALAWALLSLGFDDPHTRSLESIAGPTEVHHPGPDADLAARLARFDEAVRADSGVEAAGAGGPSGPLSGPLSGVVVVARRPR